MAIERPSPDHGDTPGQTPSISQAKLRRELRLRLERHLATNSFQPALTVIGVSRDSSDVVRHGLDQPENALLGFDLARKYSAIAVVASSVIATPPTQHHEDAALAIAVSRTDEVVSLIATPSRGVIETGAPQGWLIDACRRSVGLAAAPCDVAPLAFPIALWLDRLMVAILSDRAPDPLRWVEAVDLCPIPTAWRSADPIDLGTTLGSTTRSWRALRLATCQGAVAPVGVSARWARWMDDAMFARWCLGAFPDLANLRADVEFLAPPEVVENIELSLRAAWLAFAD